MGATDTRRLEAAMHLRPQPPARSPGPVGERVSPISPGQAGALWAGLRPAVPLSHGAPKVRLAAATGTDAARAAIDRLRARLLQALRTHGWRRVALAGATGGCGASFVTAALALSLSRLDGLRSVAVDLDLGAPGLAAALGVRPAGSIADWLEGKVPLDALFQRLGTSLALGLNATTEADCAVRLMRPSVALRLDELGAALEPDVVLFDLPPLLERDDATGLLPQVDGVLLIADATRTTAAQIGECEALIEGRTRLLGVVLNRAADAPGRGGADARG